LPIDALDARKNTFSSYLEKSSPTFVGELFYQKRKLQRQGQKHTQTQQPQSVLSLRQTRFVSQPSRKKLLLSQPQPLRRQFSRARQLS
jgi:hypothetical protein